MPKRVHNPFVGTFFLSVGVCLVAWASFLALTAIMDRTSSEAARIGRMVRAGATEILGLTLCALSLAVGAKITLALPVFIVSLGLGSFAGLCHSILRNYRSASKPQ